MNKKIVINLKLISLIVGICLLLAVILTFSGIFTNEEKIIFDKKVNIYYTAEAKGLEDSFSTISREFYKDYEVNLEFIFNEHIDNKSRVSFVTHRTFVYGTKDSTNFLSINSNEMSSEFDNENKIIEAYNNNIIDGVKTSYISEQLIQHINLIGVEESYNDIPLYVDSEIKEKIEEVLNKYSNDELIDKWMDLKYKSILNNAIKEQLSQDSLEWQTSKETLKVGLVNLPPFVYIDNNNIYGSVVGYFNEIARLLDLNIEYVIGNEEELMKRLENGELDYNYSVSNLSDSSNLFNEQMIVFSSNIQIIDNLDELQQVYFYGTQSSVENLTNNNSIIKIHNIEDLKKNISLNNFIISSESVYEYLIVNEGFDDLSVNLFLENDYSTYVHSANDKGMMVLEIANEFIVMNNILENSYMSLPRPHTDKVNMIYIVSGLIIISIILFVFFFIKVIISNNEKKRLNFLFVRDQLTYSLNEIGLKQIFEEKKDLNGYFILIDIYKFRLINEKYGMSTGDRILISMSSILDSIDCAISGRITSDEFVIIYNCENELESIIGKLTKRLEELSITFNIPELEFTFAAVKYPEFGTEFDVIINEAKNAMIILKQDLSSQMYINYSEDIKEQFLQEEQIRQELLIAMDKNELQMYYQPQINIETKEVVGCEALVRWIHPEKGIINPGEFLPIAERFGLMDSLDKYVSHCVFKQVKKWQNNHYNKLKVSFNMCTTTFENIGVADFMKLLVKKYNVDATWLSIELTEETGIDNYELTKENMNLIQELGIKFALDDFGKGYSSLNHLEKLKFNYLKIDKAFIDNIHLNKKSAELIKIIIQVANLYNMSIIAEGIEHLEQHKTLIKHDNIIGQGYYYDRPMNVESFEALLNKNSNIL